VKSTQSIAPSRPSSGHIWRFAACEFDELRRELRVRGTAVEIEAKPLEVLYQLLLHAGEAVTKDELLESVWPGLTVVDSSLATAVSKLRKALGDDAVVVTIPRVGYRLAATVQCTSLSPPDGPELHLQPGEPVPGRDQWQLTRRLDRSPSSEVWLAAHPKTHEARVFKFAPDGVRLKGLKREVTVARLLRESLGERPEFVRVLEWNFTSPPYFMESEYVGPDLVEWSDAQGGLEKIPLELRLQLLADVARAVASAHELDVLHKDLKPGNILIANRPDGTPQIKIADFGSAALLVPARLGALGITNLGFTQTGSQDGGSLTGTMLYVAPEVLAGQSPTAVSDVYALGVLLYQLAAGDFRRPLAPGWEADIAGSLLREDIALAASGDPSRRLKTAAELAERVHRLDRRRLEAEELERARQRAQVAERRRATTHARRRWVALASVTAFLTGLVSLGVYRIWFPPTSPVKTVAVLPFQNAGSDTGLDFLRLALADEISTILSHTRGVAVRPAATTNTYTQAKIDLQQVGRAMEVSSIVTGHFLKARDQLQITLEATDVETNRVLWRDTVDAPASSLIATQVQMGLRVRRGLLFALGLPTTNDPGPQPNNEHAYDLFLRSTALTLDPAPNPTGIDMLERAVTLDPAYAPAWLALSRRYYVEARYATGDASIMQRSVAAMERAAALDPDYVPAAAGVIVNRIERGDLVDAHTRAKNLVARRPDSVDAHFALSYVLRFAGLLHESTTECETAFLLDPRTQTSGLRSCAIAFLLLGDYPRAMNYLHLDHGSDFAKAFTVDMLVRRGNEEEAMRLAAPGVPQWRSYDMLVACAQRRPAEEVAALAAGVRTSDDPEANYLAASHLAYCGQTRQALSLLRHAIAGHYCSYPAIDSDPFFSGVRVTPEFTEIRTSAQACQRDFLERR
jgi:serine/threonine protein kinase/DNA-binding winged helix-turn-helix (wHTH) protein